MKKLLFRLLILSIFAVYTPLFAEVNFTKTHIDYEDTNLLAEYIKKHPDGFTLNPYTQEAPSKGYVVAPIKDAEIKIKYSQIDSKHLKEYIRNLEIIESLSKEQVYAGGWLNNDDGYYYLDAVYVVNDENQALYIASAADQLAIYNLTTSEDIDTIKALEKIKENKTFDDQEYKLVSDNINKLTKKYDIYKNSKMSTF
ncbi:hypothetical protein [Francisella frigiditurris]|uniref:Uncharacterized protein n=1 Tax=Francisella frigiditurris TaxID=1542390 RepID=A0A1J0KRP1_9GAMM|nr:hypothetical protein [Francisella frigiditurris]APC96429.1 hypothetical protein KX01_539 [Francisella frigiditurris]